MGPQDELPGVNAGHAAPRRPHRVATTFRRGSSTPGFTSADVHPEALAEVGVCPTTHHGADLRSPQGAIALKPRATTAGAFAAAP